MKKQMIVALAVCGIGLPLGSFAASFGTVSVTNHLGHVMSGELTSVTNGNFTLAGKTMPLKALPEAEQKRLKALAGEDTRTSRERLASRFRDAQLKRLDRLAREGRISSETAAEHAAALEKASVK